MSPRFYRFATAFCAGMAIMGVGLPDWRSAFLGCVAVALILMNILSKKSENHER